MMVACAGETELASRSLWVKDVREVGWMLVMLCWGSDAEDMMAGW